MADVVENFPDDERNSTRLVGLYTRLATTFLENRNFDAAKAEILNAMPIIARLVADRPESADYKTLSFNVRVNLATCHAALGDLSGAESAYLETIKTVEYRIRKDPHQPGHRLNLAGAHTNLARVYGLSGRIDDAVMQHEAATSIYRTLINRFPQNNQLKKLLADSHDSFGELSVQQSEYEIAEVHHLEAFKIRDEIQDREGVLESTEHLAYLYWKLKRYADAIANFERLIANLTEQFGASHVRTMGKQNDYGLVLAENGQSEAAAKVFESIIAARSAIGANESGDRLESYEDAASLFETSLPELRQGLGEQHPWFKSAMRGLAEAYTKLDRIEDALTVHRELLDYQLTAAEAADASAITLNDIALMLLTHEIESLRDPKRALVYAQRACELKEPVGGGDIWSYLDTLAMAQHKTGDTGAAVETQKQAVSLFPDGDSQRADAMRRLDEYEAALKAENTPPDKGGNL